MIVLKPVWNKKKSKQNIGKQRKKNKNRSYFNSMKKKWANAIKIIIKKHPNHIKKEQKQNKKDYEGIFWMQISLFLKNVFQF